MEYLDKIKKINIIAKSLKDNGLVSNNEEAVRMAEKMIEDESIHALSEQSKKAETAAAEEEAENPEQEIKEDVQAEDKTEEKEETEPVKEDFMKEFEEPLTCATSAEGEAEPNISLPEPIPEEKKGFFEKIKERFSKKEKIDEEEVEKELEKPRGFFEKIKERFKKKDDEGFEEVISETE